VRAGRERRSDERGPAAGGESGRALGLRGRRALAGRGGVGHAWEQGGVGRCWVDLGRVLAGFWAFWVLGFVLGFSFLFLNFSPTKSNKV